MASVLFTIGGAVVNALAFSGTNFVFSRLGNRGAEESKRHDLALENGELLFIVVDTGIATYTLHKYLK